MSANPTNRMGAMDATRVILPLLGVIYHAIGAEIWMGNLREYGPVMNAIHSFRMEAFFAMAGLLAGSRLSRPTYLENRLRSFLIPVATVWVLAAVVNPEKGLNLLSGNTLHLWFLICLAELSVIAIFAERFGAMRWLDRQTSWLTLSAIGVPLVFIVRFLFASMLPETGLSVAFTPVQSLYYLPYFVFGIVVARNKLLSSMLGRNPTVWLAGPVAFIALAAAGGFSGSAFETPVGDPVMEALRTACAIGLTVTVIGLSIGTKFVAGPSVVWLANASYTLYLLHFPLIKLTNKLCAGMEVTPRLVIVMVLSAGVPLVVYWLMAYSPLLKTLLNGSPLMTKSQQPYVRWIWQSPTDRAADRPTAMHPLTSL